MGKRKNRAIELLQNVIDCTTGKGKYNFSNLSNYERDNATFDAWQSLEYEIEGFLKHESNGNGNSSSL
jgi:hypothetical protein